MRLIQIKLAGFKSFVEPVAIQVPSQLVGVVGPNGCGKSNIIDAVRWVLGETRASELRGESMLDVIFNGSTHRKPAARASVELVFDNSMGRASGQWSVYAEIAIKRVLTRDGTSSYYVNQQQVRRKDIHDIFMGTGLGAKGYAIIGQGMIARIIEARPEELRVFLEEAAGVSRYKERRKETESRLADTRDNLTRVEDILLELSSHIQKLEQQAEVAKTYRSLATQGEETLHFLWWVRKQEAEHEQKKLAIDIQQAQVDLEALTTELRSIEAQSEQVRQENYVAADAVHQAQGQLYEANATVARLEAEIKYVVEARQRLEQQQNQFSAQQAQWQEQKEQSEEEVVRLQDMAEELVVQIEEAQIEVDSLEQTLPALELAWKESQRKGQEQKERITQIEQAIAVNAQAQREVDRQYQQLVTRQEKTQAEQKELSARHQNSHQTDEAEYSEAQEMLQIFQEERLVMEEQYSVLEQQKNQEQQLLQTEKEQLSGMQTRLQALSGIQAKVSQQGGLHAWFEQHGLEKFAPLWKKIQVEKGWENAFESVLREKLLALQVSDLAWAQGFLDQQPPSRFALLQLPAEEEITSSAFAELTPMLSLVHSAEKSLMLLLSYWLKNVYIVESAEQAMHMRSQLKPDVLLVLPNGHIISKYAVQFYAPDSEQSGMLERQQEIENLQKSVKAQQLLVDQSLQQYARAQQAFQQCAEALPTLRKKEQLQMQQCHALQMVLEKQRQQAEQADFRLQQINEQLAELEWQLDDLSMRKEELLAQFESQDEQLAMQQEAFVGLSDNSEAHLHAFETARQAVAQSRQRMQEKGYQQKNLQTQIQSAQNSLKMATDQQARLLSDYETLQQDLAELNDASAKAGLQEALEVRAEKEELLRQARLHLEDITSTLRSLEEKKQFAERSQEPRRARIQELMLKEQAARISGEQFEEQLSQVVNLDTAILAERLATLSPEQKKPQALQQQINSLQQQLQALGAVNLAALEELTTAQDRKVFLDTQHADLLLAIETLENAIRKIDRETRDLLQETFNNVNHHFGELFPSLFGGGEAKLVMTGEEILDAGVQVMAQPPGKRNSTIHLLSGGEKALTATALVFAMFKLNPAPFCLLDEVDAPLDDANTERYANLVKNMSQQTQFLFISHNKIAMEIANQLVGVTMQEQGVSRIVAVDIEAAMEMAVEEVS